MPTHAADGLGAAFHEVTDRARTLARLEAELATLELRQKARAFGLGALLVASGAVLGLFALGFSLATATAALATAMPTWLALLIVTLALLVLAGGAGAVGVARLRRGVPPVPEQALEEARTTTAALRGTGDA